MWLLGSATAGAVLRNALGMTLARSMGIDARIGILASGVSLTGGPATPIRRRDGVGRPGQDCRTAQRRDPAGVHRRVGSGGGTALPGRPPTLRARGADYAAAVESGGVGGAILVLLAAQVVLCRAMCVTLTFRVVDRDYDAAVGAAGFCGFMLGVTANAATVMEGLCGKYGPAPRAFLVVPVAGAFLIDFTNSLVITAMANWLC